MPAAGRSSHALDARPPRAVSSPAPMAVNAHIAAAVDAAPVGPAVGAFFDVDGTLIAGFSAVAFLRDRLLGGRMGARDLVGTLRNTLRFQPGRLGLSGLIVATAAWLRDVPERELEELAERIFTGAIAGAIYPEARALVAAHRRRGHTLALVSSATRYQVEPLARELGIPDVMCTQLEVENGRLTGRHVWPTCWGGGKALAARALAREHGIDLSRSYFYTDSDEDLPLLEIVGHPRPTNPNRRLTTIAARRGWPVQRFTARGTPSPVQIVRSTLAIGSILPALAVGAVPCVLNRSRRDVVNFGIATWGELGSALVGGRLPA